MCCLSRPPELGPRCPIPQGCPKCGVATQRRPGWPAAGWACRLRRGARRRRGRSNGRCCVRRLRCGLARRRLRNIRWRNSSRFIGWCARNSRCWLGGFRRPEWLRRFERRGFCRGCGWRRFLAGSRRKRRRRRWLFDECGWPQSQHGFAIRLAALPDFAHGRQYLVAGSADHGQEKQNQPSRASPLGRRRLGKRRMRRSRRIDWLRGGAAAARGIAGPGRIMVASVLPPR